MAKNDFKKDLQDAVIYALAVVATVVVAVGVFVLAIWLIEAAAAGSVLAGVGLGLELFVLLVGALYIART